MLFSKLLVLLTLTGKKTGSSLRFPLLETELESVWVASWDMLHKGDTSEWVSHKEDPNLSEHLASELASHLGGWRETRATPDHPRWPGVIIQYQSLGPGDCGQISADSTKKQRTEGLMVFRPPGLPMGVDLKAN